jgi:hypothetical protein
MDAQTANPVEAKVIDATPVQAPVSSSPVTPVAAQPKKGSKTVIIILVVVGVLLLCCCGTFFALGGLGKLAEQFANSELDKINSDISTNDWESTWNDLTDSTDSSSSSNVDMTLYGVKETTDYSFYYPKAYVESKTDGIEQMYKSTTTNTLKGNDSINLTATDTGSTTNAAVTASDCSDMGSSMVSSYATQFGLKESDVYNSTADVISKNGMQGCEINFELDTTSGLVYLDQELFYKDGNKNVYVVTISYDDPYSDNYYVLKDAQELFLIK